MRRWPDRALAVACALAMAGCATLVPPPAAPPSSAPVADAAWARVLRHFVNERGEVDFAALAGDRADLDRYVRHVADTPLADMPDGDARLAHMINAYNALSMFNVVASGIPATHAGSHKLHFFVLRKFVVGGDPLSLYAFENDVIRPYASQWQEPRIHFALNCSARSCPVLPRVPFRAAGLRDQLEHEARAFFARPENFCIDDGARTVWLSEILRFFAEDFVPGHAASLLEYANRYAPHPTPAGYATRFTPYDWTVAAQGRAFEPKRCPPGS